MAEKKQGRRGPKPKGGTPDQKSTISVRITAETKEKLVAATRANDRSLSQEAEIRLERSFRDEAAIDLSRQAVYGRQLAGVLELLGQAMRDTGEHAAFSKTFSLETSKAWLSEPYAFEQVVKGVNTIFEAIRPEGEVTARPMHFQDRPDLDELFAASNANFGSGLASSILDALCGDARSIELAALAKSAGDKLGDEILQRIRAKREA